jgi:protein-S-isoprenylcysteine O-methyltransferase Ste14
MIFINVLLIIIFFALFAFSHTWLASNKLKLKLAESIGEKIAFYRLFYNLSSLLFFGFFYILSPKPDIIIYDLQFPYDIITFALQVLSLAGFYWASRSINLNEFLGIAQINRFINKEYNPSDLDEKQEFNNTGAFKFVRHPIYLFSILFLGLRPTMTLFYLIMFLCIVAYFYVGSIFEERKLVERFGEKYLEYQKIIPRIFPVNIFKKR